MRLRLWLAIFIIPIFCLLTKKKKKKKLSFPFSVFFHYSQDPNARRGLGGIFDIQEATYLSKSCGGPTQGIGGDILVRNRNGK